MQLKEIGTIVSKLKAFSTASVEFNAGLKNLKDMPKWAQKAVASSRALSAEQRAAAAAAAGLAAGETAAEGATIGLGAALSGAATAAKSFAIALLANPITWIVAAIAAATYVFYRQATAFDRAKKAAEESASAYQETQGELESLNGQLQETQTRIEELQALKDAGTITLTEESELEKLQRQNAELERQIALLEQKSKLQLETSSKDARKALTDNTYALHGDNNAVSTSGNQIGGGRASAYSDIITSTKKDLATLKQLKAEYQDIYKDWEAAEDGTFKKNSLRKQLERKQDDIDEYAQYVSDSITEINTLAEGLDPNLDSDLISTIDSLNVAVASMDLSPLEQTKAQLDAFFDGSAGKNAILDNIIRMLNNGEVDTATEAIQRLGISLSNLNLDESQAGFIERYFSELASNASSAQSAVSNFDNVVQQVVNNSKSLPAEKKIDLSITDNKLKTTLQSSIAEIQKAKTAGADLSKTIYGNIDTNNRQVIQWTKDAIVQSYGALKSWNSDIESSNKSMMSALLDEYQGSYSTIMGMYDTFDGIDIAFSPMLQTENGAKVLSRSTVDKYITSLLGSAKEGWKNEDLFALDAKGLDIDGQHISNLLADIGSTAKDTAEQMHFTGDLGSVADAFGDYYDVISAEAEAAGMSIDAYFDKLIKNAERYGQVVDGTITGIGTAFETKNAGDDYVTLDGYLTQAKTLFDQGLTGTDDFKTVAEMISANVDSSAESFKANYDKLQRYFTKDKEGNFTKTGINNFVDDLTLALDKNGKAFENSAEAANAMGMSTEVFETVLGRLGDYDLKGFSEDIQDIYFDLPRSAESLHKAESSLESLKEVYNSMTAGDSKDRLGIQIDKFSDQIIEAQNDISKLDTDIVMELKVEYDLATLQTEIDAAKQKAMAGGGTEAWAETISSQQNYIATALSSMNLTDVSMPVEFTVAGDSIAKLQSQLQEALASGNTKKAYEIQAEISNQLEIQQDILDAFRNAHPEITAETDTKTAQKTLDDWINKEGGKYIIENIELDHGQLKSASDDLDSLISKAESANERLKELGKTDYNFNFNADSESIGSEIEKATALLNTFRKEDGTVDLTVSGASEAQSVLSTLIRLKQSFAKTPAIMSVDASELSSAEQSVQDTISALQQLQQYTNDLEVEVSIGADTSDTQSKIQSITESINPEVLASLGVDTSEFNSQIATLTSPDISANLKLADGAISGIQGQIAGIGSQQIHAVLNLDSSKVDGYQAPDKEGTASYNAESSDQLKGWTPPAKTGTASYKATSSDQLLNWTPPPKRGIVTYDGANAAAGTAHSSGSALSRGSIFNNKTGLSYLNGTRGDWRVGKDQDALINEVAPELIVDSKTGTWRIANNGMPGFTKLHANDIVFNGAQTRDLLERGKTSSYGKFIGALSAGSAYSSGSVGGKAFASGTSNKNTIDWIEILLDRASRLVDQFTTRLENAFDSLENRLDAVSRAISATKQEYTKQQQAYNAYMSEANKVKLSESLKKKVREGATYTYDGYSDAEKEAVDKYKDLIDKAKDAAKAMEELKVSLAELYKQAFEIVQSRYDSEFDALKNYENIIQNNIDLLEAQGYSANPQDYTTLINYMEREISKYESEYATLTSKLDSAVKSGSIKKWSTEWWDMYNSITEVAANIQEAQISLEEYQQTILDLKWDNFDYMEEQLSQITKETEFLIGLLENSDLYDDKGQFTNEGLAALSLYNDQYKAYIHQAEDYAKQISELNELIAEDPANKNLVDRRNELIESQQDLINSAQEEKEAIKDLIEEAYDAQIESLEDIVNAYEESLDAARDLNDYQKQVQENAKTIAALQKEIAALTGDNSDETRARLQQLQVDLSDAQKELEETQTDRLISEQKKLIDNFVDEYKETLFAGLDDIDTTLNSILSSIEDPQAISAAIKDAAADYGYAISDSMSEIIRFGNVESVLNDISETVNKLFELAEYVKLNDNNDPVRDSNGNVSTVQEGSGVRSKVVGFADGGYVADIKKAAIRNGDNIITVNTLKKGESVLTPQQTQWFQEYADNMPALSKLIDIQSAVPLRNIQPAFNFDVDMTYAPQFNVDKVNDYKDICQQMRDDRVFPEFIRSMTINLLNGGSSLDHKKYYR